jgi:hypothetical protein
MAFINQSYINSGVHIADFTCLSTDSKSTTGIVIGATAYETDTGKRFIFDGSAWQAVVSLSSSGFSAAATFTPAASSHAAGDCNGAAQQFSLSAPSGNRIMITDATLEIDSGTAEATAWRLYLYGVTPPSATADDGAWDLPSGDRASFLGYVDLGTAVDLGSTQWVQNPGVNKPM